MMSVVNVSQAPESEHAAIFDCHRVGLWGGRVQGGDARIANDDVGGGYLRHGEHSFLWEWRWRLRWRRRCREQNTIVIFCAKCEMHGLGARAIEAKHGSVAT
jgi:hypothetical protein